MEIADSPLDIPLGSLPEQDRRSVHAQGDEHKNQPRGGRIGLKVLPRTGNPVKHLNREGGER